jgi:hypothetical protein
MAAQKAEPARDEREFDALDVVQDVLNKMARAHKRGTGCRLTADEIHALSVTMIGQWWGQPDERAASQEAAEQKGGEHADQA